MSTRAQREHRNRQVSIDDADLERFRTELPGLLAYFEQRRIARDRRWALGAILYGAMTLAGLYLFDWSPMLVLCHVVLSQWIPLGAEIAALRRMQRSGITRLVTVDHVHRFVGSVARALDAGRRPSDPADGPMMLDRDRLDSDVAADSNDRTSPGALARLLLFFGIIGAGMVVASIYFVDPFLRAEMFADPWALAALGATSPLQGWDEYRAKLAPPMPGATWNVEFAAGLRLAAVMVLGLMSPILFSASTVDLLGIAATAPVLVGGWGLVTLACLPMWRKTIASLRRHAGVEAAELRARWAANRRPPDFE
ncbi:hypothetical protein [Pseudofulvimonas gallinarii]|uniref:Uncharacterized protein n=1 Tax=Pseudofulvimonas gallinarii TaxID=634155 RepID=A0A4V3UTW9_9GAMM|nr:hypothetical protein [Pseudofulvimonas gallinarii]TCS91500.1 hypothetical protein EDC25_1503 [Pseudofulvimonas gallinarii]THD12231.1 hypothetical protein B1808_13610 [Pseudofulvimonas gallinarii]